LIPSRDLSRKTTFSAMKMKVMTRQSGRREIRKARVASERFRI
jgi:hypothetical protein